MVRPWKRRDSFSCVAPALKAHLCLIILNPTGYFNILGLWNLEMVSFHLVRVTVNKNVWTHWTSPNRNAYFLSKCAKCITLLFFPVVLSLEFSSRRFLSITPAVWVWCIYYLEMHLNTVWSSSIHLEQTSQRILETSVGINSSEATISQVRQ